MPGSIDLQTRILIKIKKLDIDPNPRILDVHEKLIEKGIRVWLTPAPQGKELDILWAYNINYLHPERGVICEILNRKTFYSEFDLALQEGIKKGLELL